MKLLFLVFVFLIITVSAKAQVMKGTVKHFKNVDVELNREYSYYALELESGEKMILPAWIDSELLARNKKHEILLEGSIKYSFCLMRSCPIGEIKKVKWLQYNNLANDSQLEIYTGSLKRFVGVAVESPERYDYIALASGSQKVALPDFLDANQLLTLEPQVTIIGETLKEICTDMSDACGPAKLKNLSMLQLHFEGDSSN